MFTTHANTRTYTTNKRIYVHTNTDDTETHTRAYTDAGRVIQLKKVKADVFPKNDGL